MEFKFRKAELVDVERLEVLIASSSREINAEFYSNEEIEAALGRVWAVDITLVADKTYWLAENMQGEIVACGGWSKRNLLFGKSEGGDMDKNELDPAVDPARVRAFFVDPNYKRMGIGKRLLELCELAAKDSNFGSIELVATLSGEKLYTACGYSIARWYNIDLGNGVENRVASMYKVI